MNASHQTVGSLILIAALVGSVPPAFAAFECPVKAPATSKPLPDLGNMLRPYDDPRDDPSLASAIARLKGEGMANGEVVDHVVASYCPIVDGVPKLSDKDKTMLVERFASHLAEAVYAPQRSGVDAIILDVPVPPDLYAKVKEAADQRKVSQDAFVLQALRVAAGMP